MANNRRIVIKIDGLRQGCLIKRYKRFLTDIEYPDGTEGTIHCPNTGSMRNCLYPGELIAYSTSASKTRKYPHTWEWARTDQGNWIGINSSKANGWFDAAVEEGLFPEFEQYTDRKAEQKYGEHNSRIDWLLLGEGVADLYVEVKSATLLLDSGEGAFPDAVSERAVKHVNELISVVKAGKRAAMVWCVQHSGITSIRPAHEIHPEYAQACERAKKAGVEFYAMKASFNGDDLELSRDIKCW